jgi:small subunit ribosomal protein S17
VVVSDKMDKTVVVRIDRLTQHPEFKKFITRSATCKVHDPKNECRVGDKIRLVETRPLSRDKRWKLAEILERATE